jgi:hypothetical protein
MAKLRNDVEKLARARGMDDRALVLELEVEALHEKIDHDAIENGPAALWERLVASSAAGSLRAEIVELRCPSHQRGEGRRRKFMKEIWRKPEAMSEALRAMARGLLGGIGVGLVLGLSLALGMSYWLSPSHWMPPWWLSAGVCAFGQGLTVLSNWVLLPSWEKEET